MSILKIILVPLSLILSLFVWLCAGLLSCSGFVFKLASGLLLRVQAGKRPALPVGHRRDDYLLCKKWHYPPCAGVSNQPDGTSAAGGAGTWQAARRERCHEKLHP